MTSRSSAPIFQVFILPSIVPTRPPVVRLVSPSALMEIEIRVSVKVPSPPLGRVGQDTKANHILAGLVVPRPSRLPPVQLCYSVHVFPKSSRVESDSASSPIMNHDSLTDHTANGSAGKLSTPCFPSPSPSPSQNKEATRSSLFYSSAKPLPFSLPYRVPRCCISTGHHVSS